MPPKGSKRKAAAQQNATGSSKQTKQENQKNVSKDLNIPIDEGVEGATGQMSVHVDDEGTIYDASLNQSQVAKNNNKFYRLQLLEEGGKKGGYLVHTRWGRVGEFGCSVSISQTSFLANVSPQPS